MILGTNDSLSRKPTICNAISLKLKKIILFQQLLQSFCFLIELFEYLSKINMYLQFINNDNNHRIIRIIFLIYIIYVFFFFFYQ